MIPNKTKKHKTEYVTTAAQSLSQKENFGLFTLKGIQSQLHHLMSVPGIGTVNIEKIRLYAVQAEKNIRFQQALRKNKKIIEAAKKGKT